MDIASIDCRGILILILILHGCHGLLCGRETMTPYDPDTQKCTEDGIVLPLSSVKAREPSPDTVRERLCFNVQAQEFKLYDKYKYQCKNGFISRRVTPTPVTPKPATTTSTTRFVTATQSSGSRRSQNRAAAAQACKSGWMSELPEGFACCGDEAYKPKDQTCCSQSGIHQLFNVSERRHVCCNDDYRFTIHPRASTGLPCQHASTNDQFFNKMRHFSQSKLQNSDLNRTCKKTKFAFRITVQKQRHTTEDFKLVAKLTAWRFSLHDRRAAVSHLSSPYENKEITIPLDKYAPTDNKLQRKPYLVLTNFNYFSQVVFFLKPDDNLYKFPKNPARLQKVVKRLGKKCRKAGRKSRRG